MLELTVTLLQILGASVALKFGSDWLTQRDKDAKPGGYKTVSVIPILLRNLFKHNPPPLHDIYKQMAKRVGDVFMLDCILIKHVVINGYECVSDAQNGDLWIDRPIERSGMERSLGRPLGILINNGDEWRQVRKFTAKTLRNLGFGKMKVMDRILVDQLEELVEIVEKRRKVHGKVVPVPHLFSLSVINVLWGIATGGKFTADDEGYKQLLYCTDAMANMPHSSMVLFNLFYHVIKLFPSLFNYKDILETPWILNKYFTGLLEERRQLGLYKTDPKDFVDYFLLKIDEASQDPREARVFTQDQLIVTLVDLFQAGIDTASKTLEFSLMYLITNTEAQEKVQQEIEAVIGHRVPDYLLDRNQMPYTCATIMEVQRMANIVPLNFRCIKQDCVVDGRRFRKGTWAALNLYGVHMDEEFWGDPLQFRPERFLDDDMNIVNKKRIFPFGGGPRVCIGETVASATLFTFLVGLLQRFSFRKAIEDEELGPDTSSSFLGIPKPFHVTIQDR